MVSILNNHLLDYVLAELLIKSVTKCDDVLDCLDKMNDEVK